jgi:hypothetical protein
MENPLNNLKSYFSGRNLAKFLQKKKKNTDIGYGILKNSVSFLFESQLQRNDMFILVKF